MENEQGRFTLIFLGVPGDEGGEVELTHNWDEEGYGGGRNFGHLAYQVDDIYETCRRNGRSSTRSSAPATPRRPHGFRPVSRRNLGRAASEGSSARSRRTLVVDAQHG